MGTVYSSVSLCISLLLKFWLSVEKQNAISLHELLDNPEISLAALFLPLSRSSLLIFWIIFGLVEGAFPCYIRRDLGVF